MKKAVNTLKVYQERKNTLKISSAKRAIIKKAVKRAVDEYGEVYKLLATE